MLYPTELRGPRAILGTIRAVSRANDFGDSRISSHWLKKSVGAEPSLLRLARARSSHLFMACLPPYDVRQTQ